MPKNFEIPQSASQETRREAPETPGARRAEGELRAREEIGAKFLEKTKTIDERLKQDPSFEAQGRKFEIKGPSDYLVGQAQAEERIAEEILNEVRGKDFFKEEEAAKFLAFTKVGAELVKLYVEAKEYAPKRAGIFEKRDPALSLKYEGAKQSFENLKKAA